MAGGGRAGRRANESQSEGSRPPHDQEPGQLLRRRREEDNHAARLRSQRAANHRRHHRQPDVRPVSNPDEGRRARARRHGPRLLPEQQDVGDDTGWTDRLERVFRAQGSARLPGRPGVARPLGFRCDVVRRDQSRPAAGVTAAQYHQRDASGGMGRLPLRPHLRQPLSRRTVSGRSARRVQQAGDSRPQRPAADAQPDVDEHGRARRPAARRRPDGTFGIRLFPGAGGAHRSHGHQGDDLDRDALSNHDPCADRHAGKDSDACHVRRSPRRHADGGHRELGRLVCQLQRVRRSDQESRRRRRDDAPPGARHQRQQPHADAGSEQRPARRPGDRLDRQARRSKKGGAR